MTLETDHMPSRRLTAAEDSELRQLTWFARAGQLSETSRSRLAQLEAIDRRSQVRDTRPDPVSRDGDQVGTRLASQPVATVTCQNCGFGSLKPRPASTCPQCGVGAPRHDERRPVEPSNQGELRNLADPSPAPDGAP
jgi:predicted Zn-ribbon and HTH transcriptional regulator